MKFTREKLLYWWDGHWMIEEKDYISLGNDLYINGYYDDAIRLQRIKRNQLGQLIESTSEILSEIHTPVPDIEMKAELKKLASMSVVEFMLYLSSKGDVVK
ncbi:hypothetical protein ABEP42_27200 [Priestia megaterium]|uniref:hypothetical protein n=1 Tax=Priestia megaterium TaxID=1404 RepID=UPI00317682C0